MENFDINTVGLISSILYSVGCEVLNFNRKSKSNSVLEVILNVLGKICSIKKKNDSLPPKTYE